jgi:hypothetical protein
MFMEPIEVATAALTPAPRPRAVSLTLAAGLAFILLSAALMLPWALVMAGWFGVAAAARSIGGILGQARAIVLFSGRTVLGR